MQIKNSCKNAKVFQKIGRFPVETDKSCTKIYDKKATPEQCPG